MNYFKINYDKLSALYQKKYYILVMILISIILLIITLSFFIKINQKITFYGICEKNIIKIKINNELSDVIKSNKYLYLNDKKIKYNILEFGEYEIVNNEIYQEVILTIENITFNNEILKINFSYKDEKLIKFILKLFK